ncbi:MAG: hypothetical protein JRC53_05380 [Deltaproteobacteria bacterium]|nr:hypothetical protein [Deltaproteobacteria bacterium]
MEKVIRKRQGRDGLMVKVEASVSFPGEYDISVFRPGWVGTAFSPDGMGWCGAGFHGTEEEVKEIIKVILEGIEKERKRVKSICAKELEWALAKVTRR